MNRRFILWALVALLLANLSPQVARAGAHIEVNDDVSVDVGVMGQFLMLVTQRDLDGDTQQDIDKEFLVRRIRLVASGQLYDWVRLFLQTDLGASTGGGGVDIRLLEAFAELTPVKVFRVRVGLQLPPISRQTLTGAPVTMSMDRVASHHRALNWGNRSTTRFGTSNHAESDSGLRTPVASRDLGLTLYGSGDFTSDAHFKYYLGVYEGLHISSSEVPHVAGRAQINFFDAEPEFMQRGTYLGKKKTLGIGVGAEHQADIARSDTGATLDFSSWAADLFLEWPISDGALTFEAGYHGTSYAGALNVETDTDLTTPGRDLRPSSGHGVYGLLGYYINRWQPWVSYSRWMADSDFGSFDAVQAGLTFYLFGRTVNFRVAYEAHLPTLTEASHSGVAAIYMVY